MELIALILISLAILTLVLDWDVSYGGTARRRTVGAVRLALILFLLSVIAQFVNFTDYFVRVTH